MVDLAFVKERRSDVALADVRWYLDGCSGKRAYEQAHLPGRATEIATAASMSLWTHALATFPASATCPAAKTSTLLGDSCPCRAQAAVLAVGVSGEAEVVSYCGSGVTACHNLLAMEHTGLGVGRLFPGSWPQYSHSREKPVVTGAEPR